MLTARTRGGARAEAIGEQLTAALTNLAEAVVVQDREQRLVYANEAAAETLGFPSADALLGAARAGPRSLADYFDEDGAPLTPEQYPSRRVLTARRPGRCGCASSTARPARSAGA